LKSSNKALVNSETTKIFKPLLEGKEEISATFSAESLIF
jgi:hypothetical protein